MISTTFLFTFMYIFVYISVYITKKSGKITCPTLFTNQFNLHITEEFS